MSFAEQQENWQALAERDPMWAVLSEPEKRGGGWNRSEFYATGVEEAHGLIADLAICGLPVKWNRALDLGCGPGRITHELARGFDQIVGYDLTPRLLEMAREGAGENETYMLNETDDLSPFDAEFDLVYCSKVLQHVDADRIGNYLAEMVRVLVPGGTLFCQMLSHPTGWEGTSESAPDPGWGESGGPPPHYTIATVSIDGMMSAFLELGVIIHGARLVEGGRGQSLFSYDYIVQRRP